MVLKGQYIRAESASYNNREYFNLGGCCGTERPILLDVSGSVTSVAASIEIQADIYQSADQEEELEQEEDDLHLDDLREDVDEDAAEGKNMCSSDTS